MLLLELFDRAVSGYQDVSDDNSQPRWRQNRKTKLTLRQIRKLRRMHDVRVFERAKNMKKIQDQYAPPAQPAGPTL